MKDIIIAKLITSEIVVGTKDSTGEFLQNCYQMIMREATNGMIEMNLLPYMMPFENEGSDINTRFIVTDVEAPDDVIRAYTQRTTGIEIPKTNFYK